MKAKLRIGGAADLNLYSVKSVHLPPSHLVNDFVSPQLLGRMDGPPRILYVPRRVQQRAKGRWGGGSVFILTGWDYAVV